MNIELNLTYVYWVALFLATCLVSFSNGANDNFKGVATLFGSKTTNYKVAIGWATVTTFAGSVASIVLAEALITRFSGKGLVPDAITTSSNFLLAVATGAGLTVLLATLTGFPVSTTHSLTGALIGGGLIAAGNRVNWTVLGNSFFLPLLASPVIAVASGAFMYSVFRYLTDHLGIGEEWCVCVGETAKAPALVESGSALALSPSGIALPNVTITVQDDCIRLQGARVFTIDWHKALDAAHYLSAGSMSFARGLNDTPKIVALLLLINVLDIKWGVIAVATGMAVGGLLNARKVAETMSHKITGMNHGQGFTANVVTSFLVIFASRLGLPVSTTHVSVGALSGIGLMTGRANWSVISSIVLSWVLTLPIAAILSGTIAWTLSR